jgi:lysophospholipase L1-like esterase
MADDVAGGMSNSITGHAVSSLCKGCAIPITSFPVISPVVLSSSPAASPVTFSIRDDFVYKNAYISINGSTWKPFNLTGSTTAGSWIVGSAFGNYNIPSSLVSLGNSTRTFIVVYSCSRAAPWNCHDGWQIRAITTSKSSDSFGGFINISQNISQNNTQKTILLANGFENNGNLVLPFTGINNNGIMAIDSTTSYQGTYSLRLEGRGSHYYTQPDTGTNGIVASIASGDVINYSVYVKGDSTAQAGLMILCLSDQLNYWLADDGHFGIEFTPLSSWEKKTISYTCPSWAKYAAVRLSVRETGRVWYDNPTLQISTSSIPPRNQTQFCGDNSCNNGETCASCQNDCGICMTGSGFKIYQKWDFENETLGQYTEAEAAEDFDIYNNRVYMHGVNSQIGQDTINGVPTKVAVSIFPVPPAGEKCYNSPDESGYRWSGFGINAKLDTSQMNYRELYLTYNIKWSSNDVANLPGSKISGLRGYPLTSTPILDTDGFYLAPIFQSRELKSYHYDHTEWNKQTAVCSDAYPASQSSPLPWTCSAYMGNYDFTIVPGTWYTLTQRVVLNSFTNGVPNYDGINEIWVDGHLLFQESALKIVSREDRYIDGLAVVAYSNTCPATQGDVRMDNFITWINTNDTTYGKRMLHNPYAILNTPTNVQLKTCIPNSISTTCSSRTCGTVINNCGDNVICDPSTTACNACTSNSQCNDGISTTIDTCSGTPARCIHTQSGTSNTDDLTAAEINNIRWSFGPDVSQWPITSSLNSVTFNGNEICTYYSKVGSWPAYRPYTDFSIDAEANPWIIVKINGQWNACPYEWYYVGTQCRDDMSATVLKESDRCSIASWNPVVGEKVCFMVTTLARNNIYTWGSDVNGKPYAHQNQRTNIKCVGWKGQGQGCTANSYSQCESSTGDVYWYDSCNMKGSRRYDCNSSQVCSNSQCVNGNGGGTGVAPQLKIDASGRYLVKSDGTPFLMVGDTAWSLMAQVNKADADTYLLSRNQMGFNAIMVSLIEHKYADKAPANIYGDRPFTGKAFTTPNEAYFAHADYVIKSAQQKGLTVLLVPIYLDTDEGWGNEVNSATESDMLLWGQYVGNRYKNYSNIIWVIGGDIDPTFAKAKVQKVAEGIKQYNSNALFTAHNIRGQMAIDPWSGASWLNLNDIYSSDTSIVSDSNRAYKIAPAKPFFLLEGIYENEHSITAQGLRAQIYWTMLSGGIGQVFGNCPMWSFDTTTATSYCDPNINWKDELDSTGTKDVIYSKNLFQSIAWQTLVPDFNHAILTSGYGTIGQSNYAMAAMTSDKSTIIAYTPVQRTMTVNTGALNGASIKSRWYNPRDGTYVDLGTATKTSSRTYTTPTTSGPDWVLVIESAINTATATYAVIGDSMSNEIYSANYGDWPAYFIGKMNLPISSLPDYAVSGNTCEQVYNQLANSVATGTTFLFSTCGINNFANMNNTYWYERIYNKAKEKGISRIYMTTMPPSDHFYDFDSATAISYCAKMKRENEWLKNFDAQHSDLQVVDLWTMWHDAATAGRECGWTKTQSLNMDTIHPNSLGSEQWAQKYYELIAGSSGSSFSSNAISGAVSSSGSNSANGIEIIYKNTFEQDTLGSYRDDEIARDWNRGVYPIYKKGHVYIEQNGNDVSNPSKYVRVFLKKGSWGGLSPYEDSGTELYQYFTQGYDELYFSYRIKIQNGFEYQAIKGKLPSMEGYLKPIYAGHCVKGDDSFWGAMMFTPLSSGMGIAPFIYHVDMWKNSFNGGMNYEQFGSTCEEVYNKLKDNPGYGGVYGSGSTIPGLTIKTGEWHTVTERIVVNTLGKNNGIVEIYLDGKLYSQRTDYTFRTVDGLKINTLAFVTFLGGGIESAAKEDTNFYYDDFVAYRFNSGYGQVVGNTPSAANRVLPTIKLD